MTTADQTLTSTRTEHDLLGDLEVPQAAYYGVHTVRAVENFPITGITLKMYPIFIGALAAVKQAAAKANRDIGALDAAKADAIVAATNDIRSGRLHEEFIVDMIQGGAGTSTNMNANEVIANRALEHLGHQRGEYQHLHQLQDAVPMTLGQEFAAYGITLDEDRARLREARLLLHELNLGGTAIGTELNAHPEYRARAIENLREITGIPTLVSALDLVEATSDVGVFVQLSGVLKRVAVKLS